MNAQGKLSRGGASLLCLVAVFVATPVWPLSPDEARRVQIGLQFFPNVISVDQDLRSKQTPAGRVRVLLSYREVPEKALRMAETLRRDVSTVAKIPIEVVVSDDAAGAFAAESRPCGIFLTEFLSGQEFNRILQLAIDNHVILFSPFEEDMERGATAGLDIGSKIRPALNTTTLRNAGIRIHPMFLRLARLYD